MSREIRNEGKRHKNNEACSEHIETGFNNFFCDYSLFPVL